MRQKTKNLITITYAEIPLIDYAQMGLDFGSVQATTGICNLCCIWSLAVSFYQLCTS